MRARTRVLGVIGAAAGIMMITSPSYAHDCFNPAKDAHAPTAGVNYTITSFGPNGPVFEQTGPGQGIGGYGEIAAGVLFPGSPVVYVHTIGNSGALEEVGGPGSMTAEHACDGKGIDYLSVCFGG